MNTKKNIRFTYVFLLVLAFSISLAMPAFAISEADVQAQVDSVGRETVTGNVLIWFLCAIGFLKAAQKIDSFMASLGVNVGHTGGSMLAETVFSWPGVGRYMLDAIKTKDTPAVLGSVILMSVSFSVVNLLVDILYAFVDPRIKSQYKKNGKKLALRAKKQEA